MSRLRSALKAGNRTEVECRLHDVCGAARWFLISLQPLGRESDGEARWVCTGTDIHELKQREIDLERRASIQADMLNISVDCIKLIALDGTLVHMNKAGCRALGIPEDSAFGMPWLPLLPEDVREAGEQALVSARAGCFARFSGRSVLPGRRVQHWDNMLTPVMGAGGQPATILCVSREVTAERETLKLLEKSEERLAIAARVGGLGIWDYDIRNDELRCDETWYRIMGRDPAHPVRSIAELRPLIHPEDVGRATEVERTAAGLVAEERDYVIVFRIVRPDGEIRWVRSAACMIQDAAGAVVRAVGFVVDITDARIAEQQLRNSHDVLRQAEKLARTGNWTWDIEADHAVWSEMLYEIFGLGPGRAAPRLDELRGIFTPESFEAFLAVVGPCVKDGIPYSIDLEGIYTDGSRRFVNARGEPVRDGSGRIVQVRGTLADITGRKDTENRMRALGERIQLAVEAGGVGIWEMDVASQRFIWDEQMHALYGMKSGEFGGDLGEWGRRMHPDDEGRVLADWAKALVEGTAFNAEFRIIHASDGIRYLRAQARVIRNADGLPVRAIGTNWDITPGHLAQKKIQEQAALLAEANAGLQAALAEAERHAHRAQASERAKANFLAVMSHEIRTPMNGVLGMARLLEDTALGSEQREMVSLIRHSGESLMVILNDILDFSKIEAGKLRIDPMPFNLRDVVEETVAMLGPQAAQKGLDLIFDLEPGLSLGVMGDAGRIRQIITNLVGNAVKFTREGEVCVTLRQLGLTETDLVFRVEVRDTGIGIPAGAQSDLFQPFHQVDGSITRRFGGTGLGLAICRQLIELMGGRIEFVSREGGGSVFSIELSLPRVQLPAFATKSQCLPSIRALVVDDSAASRRALTVQLADLGAEAHAVSGGEAALVELRRQAAANRPYDIILIDRHMPGQDGDALTKMIRAEETLKATPLILLDARFPNRTPVEPAPADFQVVLTTPVRSAQLARSVLQALGRIDTEASTKTGASLQTIRRLRLLVADDNDLNQRVVSKMLEQMGHEIEIVDNGLEVLERLKRRKFDAILMDCHMPGIDGYETTRRIRRGLIPGMPGTDLPIIALTASAMPEDRERCLAAGMNGYVSKPLSREALEEVFVRCGLPVGPDGTTPSDSSSVEDQEGDPAVLDNAQVDRLNAFHNDQGESLWAEAHRLFLQEIPRTVEALEKLSRKRKRAELLKLAHEAAGSCAIVGAHSLRISMQTLASAVRLRAWDKVPDCLARIQNDWVTLRQLLNTDDTSSI